MRRNRWNWPLSPQTTFVFAFPVFPRYRQFPDILFAPYRKTLIFVSLLIEAALVHWQIV